MGKRTWMSQRMNWLLVGLGLLFWLAPSSADAAAGRRLRGNTPRIPARNLDADTRVEEPRPGRRNNPYEYYKSVYPKFYGGFHEHEFSNLGIPTGDVGIRGNSFFLPPW